MSTAYISRRLKIDATRIFAVIPNEGVVASPITINEHFPWSFARTHASHGVPWWTKVKQFSLDFSVSGNYDVLGTPTPYSYSVTGMVLERSGVFGDLRDRQAPGEPAWVGADVTGPDTMNAGLNLFWLQSVITATSASPFISYQADATDIAPAFFFETQASVSPGLTPQVYSFSHSGSSIVGAGTLDGNSFDLHAGLPAPILSLSASATITTLTTYSF